MASEESLSDFALGRRVRSAGWKIHSGRSHVERPLEGTRLEAGVTGSPGRTETAKPGQGKESVDPWPSGRAGLGEDGRCGVRGGPLQPSPQTFQLSRESCTQCCFLLVKPELHSLQPHDDTVM